MASNLAFALPQENNPENTSTSTETEMSTVYAQEMSSFALMLDEDSENDPQEPNTPIPP